MSAPERREVCGCEVTKCKTVTLLSFTTLNMHACKNVGLTLKFLLLEQKISRKNRLKDKMWLFSLEFSLNYFFIFHQLLFLLINSAQLFLLINYTKLDSFITPGKGTITDAHIYVADRSMPVTNSRWISIVSNPAKSYVENYRCPVQEGTSLKSTQG